MGWENRCQSFRIKVRAAKLGLRMDRTYYMQRVNSKQGQWVYTSYLSL